MRGSPAYRPGRASDMVGPEALSGGPIGKLIDGDQIQIHVDRESA